MTVRAARAIPIVLVALGACNNGGAGSAPPPSSSPAIPASAPPAPTSKRTSGPRTTDGDLATGNLDAQIRGAERLAAVQPKRLDVQKNLIEFLTERGTFLGRVADLSRAAELGEKLVEVNPTSAKAYATRAGTRATLHRFHEALADLDKAVALGERPADVERARASILQGMGRLDEALPLRRRDREAYATLSSLGAEAALLGEMFHFDEAERLFDQAVERYRDTSPFPLAWLEFQRGTMWERVGELDRAKQYYADANARLPLYAHAAAHLAALEPPARAIAILEPVVRSSDDPQYMAQLAEATRLAQKGDGAALLAQAGTRFDELVKLHPLAFADHAGWFWLGAGSDPPKALSLAQENVKERPNAAAYELLVEAAARAGKKDVACEAAEKAMELPYPTPKVLDEAARAFEACGKPERAGEAKKAREAKAKTR